MELVYSCTVYRKNEVLLRKHNRRKAFLAVYGSIHEQCMDVLAVSGGNIHIRIFDFPEKEKA